MSFSAGSVSATLSGNFSPAGFLAFDAAMKRSGALMESSERRMSQSGGRMSKGLVAVGKVGAVAAGVGILGMGAAIVKSVKLAADFEAELSRLKATTGANAAQMDRLKKSALDAGAATKFSALDAAKAQTELAKGGLEVEQIVGGGLSAALHLAAADNLELADAAATVVNAMKQFSLPAEQAAHVADALATASQSTTSDVSDLALALRQGGGVAAMAGASFDETVAALSALADASVKGADAGTSLKSFFLNIGTASPKARDAMRDLGMNIFTTKGELKSMPAIARNLREAFGDLTREQFINRAGVIAGSDAARALFAIYKAGPQGMRDYLDAQKEVGTAADMAAEKQDNLKGKIENLKGSLETAAIQFGEGLLPGLTEGAEKLTATINEMAASGQLEQLGKNMGDIVAGIVESGPQIVAGMKLAGQSVVLLFDLFRVGANGMAAAVLAPVEIIMTALLEAGKVANALNPFGDIPLDGLEKAVDKVNNFRQNATAAAGDVVRDVAAISNTLNSLGRKDVTFKIKGDPTDAQRALKTVQGKGVSAKVMKILGKDISAEAKIKQIRGLGIPEKYARILGQNADAISKIGSVQAALNALQDRTVTVTLNKRTVETIERGAPTRKKPPVPGLSKKATGRRPGNSETALVGEGRGPELVTDGERSYVVSDPTIVNLAPEDAVIPFGDPAQSGRALGLMLQMLGIQGYAKSRAPKKKGKPKAKALPIPDAVTFAAVPEDALQSDRDNARDAYQKRKERVRDLDVDIRAQKKKVGEAKGGPAKKQAREKLSKLQRDRDRYQNGRDGLQSLAQMRRHYQELQAQFNVLHKANLEIERLNAQQEAARAQMETAAKTGDASGWETARKKRGGLLAVLRDKYAKALKYAKPDTRFAAELESKLAGAQGDIADLAGEAFAAADPFEGTGMTAGERARLQQIDMGAALAALTPDLGDDTSAAAEKVGFLEQILGAAMSDPSRGGAPVITDLAGQLKQARDNLASLTGGGGATNDNADLQAQLNQRDEQLRVARRESDINAKALATFQGAGDIGMGGPRVTQNNYMLHPSDPAVLRTIGDAATAGMGLQPSVSSPRTYLGL